MATKPKAILSTHDGREASPITKASNVLFENGQTAQDILNDRQDAMISPVIENSSSMFKVGQGDNVDYSANVVNGAYESMVLKGKTMVNLIQEPSSQDVVLPYEFTEGQSVTINDTKESGAVGIELKGRTLVNMIPTINSVNWSCRYNGKIDGNTIIMSKVSGSTNSDIYVKQMNLKLEANKTYLLCYEVVNNVGEVAQIRVNDNSSINTWVLSVDDLTVGKHTVKITTSPNTTVGGFQFFMCNSSNNDASATLKNIALTEYQDGMENWDIPYFEGMQSVQVPSVKTVGKNLFDGEMEAGSLSEATGTSETSSSRKRSINFIRVSPNTPYKFSVNGVVNAGRLFLYDQNKTFIRSVLAREFSSTQSNEHYMKFRIEQADMAQGENIQIEEGSTATSYENHKSSILSLPEEVVLRSLPNGVCDTFNTRTGVYTQRIGERILDGSESWGLWQQTIEDMSVKTVIGFGFSLDGAPISRNFQVVCDKFAMGGGISGANNNHTFYVHHKELIYGYYANASTYRRLGLSVLKTRIGLESDATDLSQAVSKLKTYLVSNPIKIQYELETPIVTKINLSSTLKSWNTTTHIYSEIPENTLYPILSHSNPTYPVILKPSTKYSIVANSYSNNHTNSAINFNLGGSTASTTVGNRVTTITTPSTLSNELLTMGGRGNKLNHVMVIEGDVVGDEPYFEGICDCKSPILLNCGKNLFDITTIENSLKDGAYHYIKVPIKKGATYVASINSSFEKTAYINVAYTTTPNGNGNIVGWLSHPEVGHYIKTIRSANNDYLYINWSEGSTLTREIYKQLLSTLQIEESPTPTPYEPYKSNILSANGDKIELTEDMFEQGTINANVNQSFEQCKGSTTQRLRSKELLQLKQGVYSISIPSDYSLIVASFRNGLYESTSGWQGSNYTLHVVDTSISFGFIIKKNDNTTITTANFNESHFEIREVDKTIVLRSLPNGVCDTLNVETGEYVQRIGEIVLSGNNNESWDVFTGREGLKYFRIPCPKMAENNREQEIPKFLIADKINFNKYSYLYQSTSIAEDVVGGTTKSSGLGVQCIYVYYKNIDVVNTFKQYLQQNPITVQYQLAVPIVKTVDLSGFPFSYENGHAILSSGSIEQSLTPKVEYSVATNRNGQIRSNQKMVEKHQKELDKLQAVILANLINSQYQQTLTTLKYELSRV